MIQSGKYLLSYSFYRIWKLQQDLDPDPKSWNAAIIVALPSVLISIYFRLTWAPNFLEHGLKKIKNQNNNCKKVRLLERCPHPVTKKLFFLCALNLIDRLKLAYNCPVSPHGSPAAAKLRRWGWGWGWPGTTYANNNQVRRNSAPWTFKYLLQGINIKGAAYSDSFIFNPHVSHLERCRKIAYKSSK